MKIKQLILNLILFTSLCFVMPIFKPTQAFSFFPFNRPIILAEQKLDLTTRNPDSNINQGFSDNILLALHYLKNDVGSLPIDWKKIREPFTVSFILKPNETFVFHNNVISEFINPNVSMNSKYYSQEGYLFVAGLGGNGVCHLATLINWVASEANMSVLAKVNHDFAPINGVPKSFGTAIFSTSKDQNLYIRNNQTYPVNFVFNANENSVNLKISKTDN